MAEMYPQTLLDSELKSKAEGRCSTPSATAWTTPGRPFTPSAGLHATTPRARMTEKSTSSSRVPGTHHLPGGEGRRARVPSRRGGSGSRTDSERFRDPFAQALDHTYALRRKLSEFDGWKADDVHIVHALAFPDITVHKLVLAPDAPADIVIDRNGLTDVAGSLERVLGFHRGSRDKRKLLDTDGLNALRNILAPDITLEVPMARFLDEEAALITLTAEQARILDASAREAGSLSTAARDRERPCSPSNRQSASRQRERMCSSSASTPA